MKYYPVESGDLSTKQRELQKPNIYFKSIKTGEFRNPKKGEWYLSGAIPEAYRAPNDLSHPYHIANIVLVREKIVLSEITELEVVS